MRATKPSPTLWYITRATATSAYVALSFSVMLGILQVIARNAAERLSWLVDESHKFIATLSGVLVLGHLVTLLLDPYLPFSLINLLLPLNEPYRQTAVDFGVFGLYAMALLLLTSWLRRRMRYRLWRGVHYISFVMFALVTAHGWLAGSDSGEPWMRALYGGATAMIVFLTLVRLFVGPSREQALSKPA
jgi:predicted ferric reductase